MIDFSSVGTEQLDKARAKALSSFWWAGQIRNLLCCNIIDRIESKFFAKNPCDELFFNESWLSWEKVAKRLASIERRLDQVGEIAREVLTVIELGNHGMDTTFESRYQTFPTAHHFANELVIVARSNLAVFWEVIEPSLLAKPELSISKAKQLVHKLYESIGCRLDEKVEDWHDWKPTKENVHPDQFWRVDSPIQNLHDSEYDALLSHEWRNARIWIEARSVPPRYERASWYANRINLKSNTLYQRARRGDIRTIGEGQQTKYCMADVLECWPELFASSGVDVTTPPVTTP